MSKIRISSVKHDNRSSLWCGPAAISAVTGVGTKAISEDLRDVRRKSDGERRHRIAGVTNHEIVNVLLRNGVVPEIISDHVLEPLPPTLAKWQRELVPKSQRGDPILIRLTSHFLVVQGNWFVDSGHPFPSRLKDAPRRARVLSAWRLTSISRFPTVEDFRRSYAPSNDTVPGMVLKASGTQSD